MEQEDDVEQAKDIEQADGQPNLSNRGEETPHQQHGHEECHTYRDACIRVYQTGKK
ncbi:hypothetical protein [Sphingomonas sp. 3-13AW]|uniref:hypothetical protein n=1 Tax=Sphingomonas sp. 3-13AW TaxID=3050450 RepID=UPI003BB4E4E2